MQIRFVSSLTVEDERRVAQAIVACASSLLSLFPVAYSLRVETSGGDVFDPTESSAEPGKGTSASRFTH